jgi:hypothetical protein
MYIFRSYEELHRKLEDNKMISQNTISELNLKFKNDIMIIQNICDEFKKKSELSETLLKLNSKVIIYIYVYIISF